MPPLDASLPANGSLPLSTRFLILGKRWLNYEEPNSFPETAGESEYFRLQGCLRHLCSLAGDCLPKIEYANFWISGTTPRTFTPLAAWPNDNSYQAKAVLKSDFPWLEKELGVYQANDAQISLLFAVKPTGDCWVADLTWRQEHLGLVVFVCYPGMKLGSPCTNEVEAILALLRRLIGDTVFTLRLELLAAPVRTLSNQPSHQEYCESAVKVLLRGMSVDGVVLRLYEVRHGSLDEVARAGDMSEEGIGDNGQTFRESISRRVFNSAHGIGMLSESPHGEVTSVFGELGETLTVEEKMDLTRIDIHGVIILRLESNRRQSGTPQPIGTVAVFSREPRTFSSRDIQLLRTFAQRTADELSLLQAKEELDTWKLKLETSMDACTRAELVALLAHDLFKRVSSVAESIDNLRSAALKSLREKRGQSYLTHFTDKVTLELNELKHRVYEIKRAHKRLDEEAAFFNAADIAIEVQNTIESSLRSIQMDCNVTRRGNIGDIFGVAGIWRMVLLNLVMNSIDAQKELRKPRKNVISINCREELVKGKRCVKIIVSDEGPGINRQKFISLNSIFEMGATSKSEGTGLGLAVSRSLVQTYFGGSLLLVNEKPTTFEVSLYDQNPSLA